MVALAWSEAVDHGVEDTELVARRDVARQVLDQGDVGVGNEEVRLALSNTTTRTSPVRCQLEPDAIHLLNERQIED